MQPDVKIAMTIHPEVSHEIMENTFEGALLAHLLVPLRTATGYELAAPNGVNDALAGLDRLISLAERSPGELAARMLPIISKAYEENVRHEGGTLIVDDLSEELGEMFDLTTVLQEVCRQHPAEHPYFQVLWSTFVEGSQRRLARHGMMSGGADVVTATDVKSLNAQSWLEQQTKAVLELQAVSAHARDWNFVGTHGKDAMWHIGLAPVDVRRIIAGEPADELHIKRDGDGKYDLYLWMAKEGNALWLEVDDTLTKAMESAEYYIVKAETESDQKLCESLGLSFEDWSISWDGETEVPKAVNRREPNLQIVYEGDHTWTLYMELDELGQSRDPSVLAKMVTEVHGDFFDQKP